MRAHNQHLQFQSKNHLYNSHSLDLDFIPFITFIMLVIVLEDFEAS